MGSYVFSLWTIAVVCANYSLGEAHCQSRDTLTDRTA